MNFRVFLVAIVISVVACGQPTKSKYMKDSHKYTNELINESSPYLLEHAHNPVEWYPWGEKALEKAEKENKPLIISIGYAACHWCHVMEKESFVDTQVAKVMNDNFICIKIDREERTDLDNIYMSASQILGRGGGWPLNVFALPDGRPFYAGTYFPKDQWIHVMNEVAKMYKEQPQAIVEQAEAVTKGLRTISIIKVPENKSEFSKQHYDKIFDFWRGNTDEKLGGFNRAPKFPMPVGWDFLLQYHKLTGNKEAMSATSTVLDKMAEGGIYDQVGGGFARYSVDKEWLVPHFEKMLYDNGQLVSLYADAYKLTQKPLYKTVVEETLEFVERELMDNSGGFYSSLNADSEGEEGKFYVWTKQELTDIFDEKALPIILDYYNVTKEGNWEHGINILHVKESQSIVAKRHSISEAELQDIITNAKNTLLAERKKRIRPSTDDKILTSWNAMMLKGYIKAYQSFGNEHYLQVALKNARFLEEEMIKEDHSLWRNYKDGKPAIMAFSEDYALLADAYIELYQTTFNIHWLELSKRLIDYSIEHFQDTSSQMFYYTSDEAKDVLVRSIDLSDNVIPSANSVMAHNLYKLGLYYDNSTHLNICKDMLHVVEQDLKKNGPYYANWSLLYGLLANGVYEVAIVGESAKEKLGTLHKSYYPNVLYLGGKQENLPLLQSKAQEGKTVIYVCKDKSCKLPTESIDTATGLID